MGQHQSISISEDESFPRVTSEEQDAAVFGRTSHDVEGVSVNVAARERITFGEGGSHTIEQGLPNTVHVTDYVDEMDLSQRHTVEPFRSNAEQAAAFGDKRYHTDPEFRQWVYNRLARTMGY